MKKVIAVSALISAFGTTSFACSVEEREAYSNSISGLIQDIVAQDDNKLGKVMFVMNSAAVSEYHSGMVGATCVRQRNTLDALNTLAQELEAEQSVMLQLENL